MMMIKLPILVCAEKLETEISLPHQKPRTKTDKQLSRVTRSSATAQIARDADDVIQGHLRSSVVMPIDPAYMTSC